MLLRSSGCWTHGWPSEQPELLTNTPCKEAHSDEMTSNSEIWNSSEVLLGLNLHEVLSERLFKVLQKQNKMLLVSDTFCVFLDGDSVFQSHFLVKILLSIASFRRKKKRSRPWQSSSCIAQMCAALLSS